MDDRQRKVESVHSDLIAACGYCVAMIADRPDDDREKALTILGQVEFHMARAARIAKELRGELEHGKRLPPNVSEMLKKG